MNHFLSTVAAGFCALLFTGCAGIGQRALTDVVHPERTSTEYRYKIHRAERTPELNDFLSPTWDAAETGVISNFRFSDDLPSKFLPETKFRMLYDDKGIYVVFLSHDRYIVAASDHHGATWSDNTFELFLQPAGTEKYWNFECNSAGKMMASFRPQTETPGSMRFITDEEIASMQIFSTLTEQNSEPILEPISCTLGFFLPFSMLAAQSGLPIDAKSVAGKIWRGNLYHCGYVTGNPHWAGWAWVPAIDFHLPEYFGYLIFD